MPRGSRLQVWLALAYEPRLAVELLRRCLLGMQVGFALLMRPRQGCSDQLWGC